MKGAVILVLEMAAAISRQVPSLEHRNHIQQELTMRKDAGTTKHDHGWRYIVRNFTPAYDTFSCSKYFRGYKY